MSGGMNSFSVVLTVAAPETVDQEELVALLRFIVANGLGVASGVRQDFIGTTLSSIGGRAEQIQVSREMSVQPLGPIPGVVAAESGVAAVYRLPQAMVPNVLDFCRPHKALTEEEKERINELIDKLTFGAKYGQKG